MNLKTKEVNGKGIKITMESEGKEVARGYLYLISNDLHHQPYGFMEDIFVLEEYRGKGYGKKIVNSLIEEAKKQGCYKLLGTSRHGREKVHKFYENLGFHERGKEFRMDL